MLLRTVLMFSWYSFIAATDGPSSKSTERVKIMASSGLTRSPSMRIKPGATAPCLTTALAGTTLVSVLAGGVFGESPGFVAGVLGLVAGAVDTLGRTPQGRVCILQPSPPEAEQTGTTVSLPLGNLAQVASSAGS